MEAFVDHLAFIEFEEERSYKTKTDHWLFRYPNGYGASVTATTHIEELEWKFGYGWFKWLSWFRKPVVRRSLNIRFDKEVGPNKHEWKGVVGTGIGMLPGELHEDAFRRFCDKEHKAKYENYRVQFVRRIKNE